MMFDTENFIEIKNIASGGITGTYTVPDNTVGMLKVYASLSANTSFYVNINGYSVKKIQTGENSFWIHDLIPLVVHSGDVIDYKAPAAFTLHLLPRK